MADNLTTFKCRLSTNLGASTSWNPVGLSRPVMGLPYLNSMLAHVLLPRAPVQMYETKYTKTGRLHTNEVHTRLSWRSLRSVVYTWPWRGSGGWSPTAAQRPGFISRPVHLVFEVDKVAMGQVLLLRSCLLSIIARVLHPHFFICQRKYVYISLGIDSVVKSQLKTHVFCVCHCSECSFIVQLFHSH
jgi:hypothetical protein